MADLVVPQLGESITEAVIARWLKNVGETVSPDEPVVDLETDKITLQLPAPAGGALTEQRAAVGSTVRVGQVVGTITAGVAGMVKAPVASSSPPLVAPPPPPQPVAAAPVAAPGTAAAATASSSKNDKLDKEALLKLSPSQRAEARERGALPSVPAAASPSGQDLSARLAAVDPRDEVVAMSPLRKRIAERLVQVQQETASLTTFNEIDMSAIMSLRSRYKDSFEKAHGTKLGFMSFFVKACVHACRAYPGVNAEVIGSSIVYKKHYDFGIAVSTPKGLVVPVLRNCETLSFAQIEAGIAALAEKARTGKLSMDDLLGGTFSITNGGIYGSMMSTPLLNYPQSGILGMHNIVKRAVVVDDAVVVRPMMYLALTYDHRVVDGKEAVSFLVAVKERLENPDQLMLGV